MPDRRQSSAVARFAFIWIRFQQQPITTSSIEHHPSLSPNSPLTNQLVPLLLDQLGRLIDLEPALKMADPVQDRVPLGQEILEYPSFVFTIQNASGCPDPGFVPRVQEFELFGS
jgi:hypothetical protein